MLLALFLRDPHDKYSLASKCEKMIMAEKFLATTLCEALKKQVKGNVAVYKS